MGVYIARMLMTDPLISGAVLFSHSVGDLNVIGVIIEPSIENLIDLDTIREFKSNIWQVSFHA